MNFKGSCTITIEGSANRHCGLVFGGGIAYVAWYKKRVLDKVT